MFPNHTNTFQVTPTTVGQYAGKCAELCGDYHSAMLFNVEIVERDVYDAQLQELREAGQDGQLGPEMNPLQSNEQIWRTKMEQGEECQCLQLLLNQATRIPTFFIPGPSTRWAARSST